MHEINPQHTEAIGGGNFFFNWGVSQLFSQAAYGVWGAVTSGQVDYSGVAESQGTYYNMVGA